MVDLMMWLVIVALLLAAAIQGIGYYQTAVYLYHMKNDAHAAGTNSMTQATGSGAIDKETVETAATDTKWSSEVSYVVEEPIVEKRKPYIRVSHEAVTDRDVIYLFDSCGDDYAVGVNVVPKESNPILENCGIVTAPDEGGGTVPVSFARSMQCGPETYGVTAAQVAAGTDSAGAWNSYTWTDGVHNNTPNVPSTEVLFLNSAGQQSNTGNHPARLYTFDGTANMGSPYVICYREYKENGGFHRVDGPANSLFINHGQSLDEWYINNVRHRDDGPAKIQYAVGPNGTMIPYKETWYTNGLQNRAGGEPAYISTSSSTGIRDTEEWWINGVKYRTKKTWSNGNLWTDTWINAAGQIDRADGPAYIQNNVSTNAPEKEDWKKNGVYHRVGGPALQTWHTNGQKMTDSWYVDGVLHREMVDGPAKINWSSTGLKTSEEWRVNGVKLKDVFYTNGIPTLERWYNTSGQFHRVDLPALTKWDTTGKKLEESWYTNGVRTKYQTY